MAIVAAWFVGRWLGVDRDDFGWDWWWYVLAAGVVLLLATAIAIVVAGRRSAARGDLETGAIGATLLGTFPLIFALAAITTVVVFILPVNPQHDRWHQWYRYVALAAGLLVSSLTGLALAFFYRKATAPSTVNPRVYGELRDRWNGLHARLQAYCPRTPTEVTGDTRWALAPRPEDVGADAATVRARDAACSAAWAHHDFIGTELGVIERPRDGGGGLRPSTGARWVLGTGFIDLWGHLHSAEQDLFLVQPEVEVSGNGVCDEMRLKDSGIDNSTDFIDKLRWGVTTLGGGKYLAASPPLPEIDPAKVTEIDRERARVMLREVRRGIDEYRDSRREGLVRARNQLLWTGTVTGIAAYVLLGVAVLTVAHGEQGRQAILAAVAFFLVGAAIGLFDQLRRGWGTETATEEDYGLTRARLLYTPLLSGLAAVGGVVVTAMLYGTLNGTIVTAAQDGTATATPTGTIVAGAPVATATPTPSPTPIATPVTTATAPATAPPTPTPEPPGVRQPVEEVPSLGRIFDLDEDRFGLVIAAVFGLTPGLLVSRLQNQATRYTSDLQSTSAQSTSRAAL